MRVIRGMLVLALLSAGAAAAQTTVPTPETPAVATGTGSLNAPVNPTGNAASSVNASGTIQLVPMADLAPGANSFTEAQARRRIEGAGFTAVTSLKKDDSGIWRGEATRNGRTVAVGFDYKGQVAEQ